MPVVKLNQDFINSSLTCPEGKRRSEYCDGKSRDAVPGLYIEVRATSPGQGTFYLRYKDDNGTTRHQKIGRTTDIDLATAREKAKELRAKIALGANPSVGRQTVCNLSSFSRPRLTFSKISLADLVQM